MLPDTLASEEESLFRELSHDLALAEWRVLSVVPILGGAAVNLVSGEKSRGGGRIVLGLPITTGAGESVDIAQLLKYEGRVIESANASTDGALILQFKGGTGLIVDGADDYEAWEFFREDGSGAVSTPGRVVEIFYSAEDLASRFDKTTGRHDSGRRRALQEDMESG